MSSCCCRGVCSQAHLPDRQARNRPNSGPRKIGDGPVFLSLFHDLPPSQCPLRDLTLFADHSDTPEGFHALICGVAETLEVLDITEMRADAPGELHEAKMQVQTAACERSSVVFPRLLSLRLVRTFCETEIWGSGLFAPGTMPTLRESRHDNQWTITDARTALRWCGPGLKVLRLAPDTEMLHMADMEA